MKEILGPKLVKGFRKLSSYVESLLMEFENYKDAGDSTNRRIDTVSSRIKSEHSIRSKLSRLQITDPLLLSDIAGVRVVCYTLNGVSELASFLDSLDRAQKIRLVDTKDNSYIPRPRSGYRGYHLIVQAGAKARIDVNRNMRCEIQVLTLLQNAWATLSRRYALTDSSNANDEAVPCLRHVSEVLHELDAEIAKRELSW